MPDAGCFPLRFEFALALLNEPFQFGLLGCGEIFHFGDLRLHVLPLSVGEVHEVAAFRGERVEFIEKLTGRPPRHATMIAEELLKREVLFKDDMERLLGKRIYEDAVAADEEPLVPESILNPNV